MKEITSNSLFAIDVNPAMGGGSTVKDNSLSLSVGIPTENSSIRNEKTSISSISRERQDSPSDSNEKTKRHRSGSISGRLRAVSDLEEIGIINKVQKGIMKDLLITGDIEFLSALDKYQNGDQSELQEFINKGVLENSHMDILGDLDFDFLSVQHDQNFDMNATGISKDMIYALSGQSAMNPSGNNSNVPMLSIQYPLFVQNTDGMTGTLPQNYIHSNGLVTLNQNNNSMSNSSIGANMTPTVSMGDSALSPSSNSLSSLPSPSQTTSNGASGLTPQMLAPYGNNSPTTKSSRSFSTISDFSNIFDHDKVLDHGNNLQGSAGMESGADGNNSAARRNSSLGNSSVGNKNYRTNSLDMALFDSSLHHDESMGDINYLDDVGMFGDGIDLMHDDLGYQDSGSNNSSGVPTIKLVMKNENMNKINKNNSRNVRRVKDENLNLNMSACLPRSSSNTVATNSFPSSSGNTMMSSSGASLGNLTFSTSVHPSSTTGSTLASSGSIGSNGVGSNSNNSSLGYTALNSSSSNSTSGSYVVSNSSSSSTLGGNSSSSSYGAFNGGMISSNSSNLNNNGSSMNANMNINSSSNVSSNSALANVHRHSDNPDVRGYVGAYSPEQRRKRIEKFLEKRNRRVWTKKVKYDVRKNFADSRLRVKGRFVKKEEENIMRELLNM